ncbi:MAG: helix-turn-helix transcriptional regulator [Prevotella sp.]|nr:helix-turn-helix transcriptional regulator [Prevotella sp.]
MDTLEQISPRTILFFMLYGGAAVVAAILFLYILLRRGNAFAANITPPLRLRRWAAAFFAVAAVGHLWWFLLYTFSGFTRSWGFVELVVLDCFMMLTTVYGTLLSMLQDRRRPVWPFVAAMAPIVVLGGLQIVWPGTNFVPPIILYTLLLYVVFIIYMVVAIRQYGQWLRDNYADLEHKEVWQSHALLILFLLLLAIYGFTTDGPSMFLLRIADFVLFGLLLWRVETLPTLDPDAIPGERGDNSCAHEPDGSGAHAPRPERKATGQRDGGHSGAAGLQGKNGVGDEVLASIGQLLTERCVDTGLYLQHDLTLAQLSATIGFNRTYLSQYFSSQGMNYNAYINGLRINHFVSLYQEAVAAQRTFTLQQLASDSGYGSYSTFSLAFKQRMGQSVTAWMQETK